MPAIDPTPLPIAVRVYPVADGKEQKASSKSKPWKRPSGMLVFDTETRTDATQRLTFGSYRFFDQGECLEEGLFHADDLPEGEKRILEQYVANHRAHTSETGNPKLRLLTLPQFNETLFRAAYKGRCLLVGFNLPFDLSRIANDFGNARGRFAGGFSLGFSSYTDDTGAAKPNHFRPRIGIKHIDSKRALKGFTSRNSPDNDDLIPEGSETREPEPGYKFRGHILDLRTLAFALTDRGYSLEAACEAFGVEHKKQRAAQHGKVTEDYINYNRRDVLATSELAEKLLEEFPDIQSCFSRRRRIRPLPLGKRTCAKWEFRRFSNASQTFLSGIWDSRNLRFSEGERARISERRPFPLYTRISFRCIPPSIALWTCGPSSQLRKSSLSSIAKAKSRLSSAG
jgi:hypothetical protein